MANAPDKNQLATLQLKTKQLAANPQDVALRTDIIRGQVNMTAQQLGVSNTQAADVVRSYTAAYAVSKQQDPQAVLDALSTEEQNILNYSKDQPKLYGVDLITAQKIAGYLGLGSGVLLGGALVLFTIALFTVGPEAAATIAAGEGVVGTIGAALGNPLIASGGFLFLLSQFLGHLSSGIPMMTKQMLDNGSIGPGLRITAIKDAADLQAKLSGTTSPGPFTGPQFDSYARGLELAGVSAINDPTTGLRTPYSRAALAKLITYVYGQAILNGTGATVVKLTPKISQYLIVPGGSSSLPVFTGTETQTTTNASSGGSSTRSTGAVSTAAKVLTGIVSQGVLSEGLTFTPRPSDLIESAQELQDAAQNNLASWLAALPGRIVYELKIVSSVTTADGFKQTGTTQQIQTGTFANGTPKFKTVTNKFAVLVIYALTDKNSRTRLAQITLGPTNSGKLIISQGDLNGLATSLPSLVSDVKLTDISGVAPADVPAASPAAPTSGSGTFTVKLANGQSVNVTNSASQAAAEASLANYASSIGTTVISSAPGATTGAGAASSAPNAGASVSSSGSPSIKLGANATTLGDWYAAQNLPLPPVSERAQIYQGLGLGQANYYTGTAEQNTSLLSALKSHS